MTNQQNRLEYIESLQLLLLIIDWKCKFRVIPILRKKFKIFLALRRILYYNKITGALAQLGARHTGSVEATGSSPVCSILTNTASAVFFVFPEILFSCLPSRNHFSPGGLFSLIHVRNLSPYFSYLNSPTPETASISRLFLGLALLMATRVLSENTM